MGASYKSTVLSVTTSRVALTTASGMPKVAGQLLIKNGNSTVTDILYVGGPDVTTSNGFPIAGGDSIGLGDLSRSGMVEDTDLTNLYLVGSTTISARFLVSIWDI